MEDGDAVPEAYGVVVERDRGSWPFALLDGEPLVAWAARAMGEATIQLLDHTVSWDDVRRAGQALVWHDALCPLTPPGFLADCVRRAVGSGVLVVGVLPVTDTVKEIVPSQAGPVVGATHDREALHRLASPLVLPPSLVRQLDDWPSADLREVVTACRDLCDVVLVSAPRAARRVHGDLDLLALSALSRR
jgi:2-C-methyl-D-erythritol 4-phosphate cytidylyltransferase